MDRHNFDMLVNALKNLNRVWDDLGNEDTNGADELERDVLTPLYAFAEKHGVQNPADL